MRRPAHLPKRTPKAETPAPATVPDVDYIPESLRPFAVRLDSLVYDPDNVKLHGDRDLEAQQQSLRTWGFTRLVIVRRETRQIVIGNGSVMAAARNGWEYVPADFRDLTEAQARALAAADNFTGTLADWNEEAIQRLLNDLPELDLGAMELDLQGLCHGMLEQLDVLETGETETPAAEAAPEAAPEVSETGPQGVTSAETPGVTPVDIRLSHRLLVGCKDEEAQRTLMGELIARGFECRISTVRQH